MLSFCLISLLALTSPLVSQVQGTALPGQSVEFVITSPSGLTTCLTANGDSDGAIVTAAPCARVPPIDITWTAEYGGSSTGTGPATNIRVFGDKCLDVTNGVNADGTKVQIWTCGENNPNQLWNVNSDGHISWSGKGKCLDVTDGHFGDGTQLQVWTCFAGNTNQIYTTQAVAVPKALIELEPVRANSIPWCLTATGSTNGSPVVLDFCAGDSAAEQQWSPPPSGFGAISLFGGTMCLDVKDGVDANGTPLQLWSCVTGNSNQKWAVTFPIGSLTIQWAHHTRCLNAVNRVNGSAVQMLTCGTTGGNQTWGQDSIS